MFGFVGLGEEVVRFLREEVGEEVEEEVGEEVG